MNFLLCLCRVGDFLLIMAMAMEDRSLLNGNSNNGGVHTATRAMTGATSSAPIVCSGCGKLIADKYLLKVSVYLYEHVARNRKFN